MLALISPAKTLDYETSLPTDTYTQPRLLEQSQQLIDVCRKLSATEIASLMSVSEKIANLNVDRFRDWNADFDFSNARQAALSPALSPSKHTISWPRSPLLRSPLHDGRQLQKKGGILSLVW